MRRFFFYSASIRSLLTAATLLPTLARAQTPVSGTVRDAASQQPLPGAAVLLFALLDSAHAQALPTNPDGSFRFAALPGRYVLRASMLGYQTHRQGVEVGSVPVRLPPIVLLIAATKLREVIVQAERPVVQASLDKKVIEVGKDLTSTGGTAVDVLRNVPAVTVNESGAVTMRGHAATVLIDGKNTPLRLDQLPATQIAQIEVITNPGAQYDAQGAGGVINVILKKEQREGWNSSGSGLAGTGDKYNLSVGGNRKTAKLNFAAQYNGFNSRFGYASDQTQQYRATATTLRQQESGTQLNQLNSLQLSLDYTPAAGHQLTLTVVPHLNHYARSTDQRTRVGALGDSARQDLMARNRYAEGGRVVQTSLDYHRQLPDQPGRRLNASLSYYGGTGDVLLAQDMLSGLPQRPQWESKLLLTVNTATGQLDYIRPLGKQGQVEAGFKTSFQQYDNKQTFGLRLDAALPFTSQPGQSYDGRYQEVIPAAYATASYQGAVWRTQAGLRAEHTHVANRSAAPGGTFGFDYLNWFPSASLDRALGKAQQLQLAFSHRLNRPAFQRLLPTPFFSDLRAYSVGNPLLRPEYLSRLALDYELNLPASTLSASLFAQRTTQAMQSYQFLDAALTQQNQQLGLLGDVVGSTTRNNGRVAGYGLEASLTQSLTKWWRLTASGALLHQALTADFGAVASTQRLTTGSLRLLNGFSPTARLDVQVSANYSGAQLTPQTRRNPIGYCDLAVRQQLFGSRAALILQVSDLLDTRQQQSTTATPEFSARSTSKRESRIGYLGFSWYVGKSKAPKRIEAAQDNQ